MALKERECDDIKAIEVEPGLYIVENALERECDFFAPSGLFKAPPPEKTEAAP